MRVHKSFLPATALAVIFCAQGALADLTAADVWQDWKGYLEGMGYEVTGAENQSGAALTVSDLSIAMQFPEGEGTFAMQLGPLLFKENGDGTVAIEMPEAMPLKMSTAPATDEAVEISLSLTQSGMQMSANGAPDDIRYDYSADLMSLLLTDLIIDGEDISESDASGNVTLSGLSGSTQVSVGELRHVTQSGSAANATYTMNFSAPDGSSANATGSVEAIEFGGTLTVPLIAIDPADTAAWIDSGFSAESAVSVGAGSVRMDSTSEDGPMQVASSSESGSFEFGISSDGLRYDIAQTGISVDVTAAAAPMPLAFQLADLAFKLTTPVKKSEENQDFTLAATLGGFTMSDLLWSIFDATGQLPRDPATIALDLTGKTRLLFDMFDPAAVAAAGNETMSPAELESLNINSLQVSAAGAELTGTGALTFDNSQQPAMMPPVPEGSVELKLVGGNGLLDKLVGIGIVPQDQAMGVRMMMGLFGVPGTEPDTLTSKIEFREGGQILANGQRIK